MSGYRCISYTGTDCSTLGKQTIVPLVVIDEKRKIAYASGSTIEWIFGGVNLVQIISNLYKYGKIKRGHSVRSRRIYTLGGSVLYKAIKNTSGIKTPPKVLYPINAVVDSLTIDQQSNIVEERALLVGLDPYGNSHSRKNRGARNNNECNIHFNIIPGSILRSSSSSLSSLTSVSSSSSPPPTTSSTSRGWYSKNNEFGLSEHNISSTLSTSVYPSNSNNDEMDDNNSSSLRAEEEYYFQSSKEEEEEEEGEDGDYNLLSDREMHETSCLLSSPSSSPRIVTRLSSEYTLGKYITEFKNQCPMTVPFTHSKLWKYIKDVYMDKKFFKFGNHSRKDIIQDIVDDPKFRLKKIPLPPPEHEEVDKDDDDDDDYDDDDDIFKDLIPLSPSSSPPSSPPPPLSHTYTTCSACCTFRKPSYYCHNKELYYGSSCGNKIMKIAWVIDQLDRLAKGTKGIKLVNSDLIKNEILFFASNKCKD